MNFVDDLMEDEKTLEFMADLKAKLDEKNPEWEREWFNRATEEVKKANERNQV